MLLGCNILAFCYISHGEIGELLSTGAVKDKPELANTTK